MNPTQVLDLRIVVAVLGESHQFGWWQSQFLSSIGLSYLTYAFPRSAFPAAVRSAVLAACAVHDNAVGKGAVAHLFRLDEQTERALDQMLASRASTLAERYRLLTDDRVALLARLGEMAGTASVGDTVGPILVTAPGDRLVPSLAAAYRHAFTNNRQVFPYFNGAPTGDRRG